MARQTERVGEGASRRGRAGATATGTARSSGGDPRALALARRREGVGGGRESCFFPAVRLLSWEGAGRLLVGPPLVRESGAVRRQRRPSVSFFF